MVIVIVRAMAVVRFRVVLHVYTRSLRRKKRCAIVLTGIGTRRTELNPAILDTPRRAQECTRPGRTTGAWRNKNIY